MGREDALEEEVATHSSILAWRILRDRGAWRATVHGVRKDWTRPKRLSTHAPPPCILPLATLLIRFLHVDSSPPSEPSDPRELSGQTWNAATHHRYLRLQAECLSILNTPTHTAASRQLELRSR